MLKNILKLKGAQELNKAEQLSTTGGSGGFSCSFGGVCFNALNRYHCIVQMGLQPC